MDNARLVVGALAVMAACAPARPLADSVSYEAVLDLRAAGRGFVVRHHHDWSSATEASRWKMISTHRDPFGRDNEYAFVAWYSPDERTLIRKQPSPALTWLGVSADSKYVIGLSGVMLLNPIQVVVYSADGTLLLKRHIAPEVACLSLARYGELLRRFPGQFELLKEHVWTEKGSVYVDFRGTAQPDRLGKLWNELLRHVCRSPLSPNFSQSVTNWVWWFDAQNPAPEVIETDGKPAYLRLRDPKGIPFVIPFRLERPSP